MKNTSCSGGNYWYPYFKDFSKSNFRFDFLGNHASSAHTVQNGFLKFIFEWTKCYEIWKWLDRCFNACLGISFEVYQANIGSSIRAVHMGNTFQIPRNKVWSKSAIKIHIFPTNNDDIEIVDGCRRKISLPKLTDLYWVLNKTMSPIPKYPDNLIELWKSKK